MAGTSGAPSTGAGTTTGSTTSDAASSTTSTSSGAGGASATSSSSTGSGGSASPCSEALEQGDADVCPRTPRDAIVAQRMETPCSQDDVSCTYQTVAGETNCVNITFVCCGEWYSSDECPRVVEGSDAECPMFEPSFLDDDPCTTEGAVCGYRPSGPGQTDYACCDGYWTGCAGSFDSGPPDCTCD